MTTMRCAPRADARRVFLRATSQDAPLSEMGHKQCAALRAALWSTSRECDGDDDDGDGSNDSSATTLLRKCWLVMCSPYTRTLQTAGLVFGHPECPGPRIRVMPELGEYVSSSCDIGRNGRELLQDPLLRPAIDAFPSLEAQLLALDDGWWGPERRHHLPPGLHIPQRHREDPQHLRDKSTAALVALAAELESGAGAGGVVAIVSHSKWFHETACVWLANCAPTEVELVAPDAPGKPPSLRVVGNKKS
jgi:broad specificity phosphatase PhoE